MDSPTYYQQKFAAGFPKPKHKNKGGEKTLSPGMSKKAKKRSSKRTIPQYEDEEDMANLDSSRKLL